MVKLWRRGRSEVISSLYCGVGHFCNATTDYSQRGRSGCVSLSLIATAFMILFGHECWLQILI